MLDISKQGNENFWCQFFVVSSIIKKDEMLSRKELVFNVE